MPAAPRSLASVLWRYAYAYTAAHDFSVSDEIMVDDYVLRMGEHVLTGRLDQYQPATERQYRQYPTLGFTVHRLVTNGHRAALHFTEHGRSIHDGRSASWQGVSLYRWDAALVRLTECRVEQDYYSRRTQLDSGAPLPVGSPGIDPWSEPEAPRSSEIEDRALAWLDDPSWTSAPEVDWNDGRDPITMANHRTEVLDLFSAGSMVAFHARVSGAVSTGPASALDHVGDLADLYVTGMLSFEADRPTGQVVSDRHSMLRRLDR